ncbi:hypothetical protein BSPWISOXPB_139 [uncultured Gammaproteobacteria bacterium]|nr:hypothetical protein BSPWISOXPB_139 [uncultured Gammaproteobacteria bacterium]
MTTLEGSVVNLYISRCINRNNHQKPTFHPLGDFLNPALALLGQGLKKSPIGQKLDFANHPYLCKGLSEYKRRSLDKEAQALYKKLQTKGNRCLIPNSKNN